MLSSFPVQVHLENSNLRAKTPGRLLKNRVENAHPGGAPMTVNGKSQNAKIAPRTPFQPLGHSKKKISTAGRPLSDKTPLPNRLGAALFQTPLPTLKPSRLRIELQQTGGGTPESLQRPSSARKHIKYPRNSGKAFETPINNGKHWDVSDGDVVIEDVQSALTVEDDFDEVEYGPPNTRDLPYQPPFDFELPDYQEVGKTLFNLGHRNYVDDASPPPEIDSLNVEVEDISWKMFSFPDLESEDPFYLARRQMSAKEKKVPPTTTLRAKPNPVPKPRPRSSMARLGTQVAKGPNTRPVSSTTVVAPPITKAMSSNGASQKQALCLAVKPNVIINKKANQTIPTRGAHSRVSSTRSLAIPPNLNVKSSDLSNVGPVKHSWTLSLAATTSNKAESRRVNIPKIHGGDNLVSIKNVDPDIEELDFKFDV